MTKKESNIAKGIALIMMYIHHLFYDREKYAGVDVIFGGVKREH